MTQVNATGAASWTRSYIYDAEGRTKTRPGSGANQQTLAWNEEGRFKSVTEAGGTTSYVYDADGNVLARKGPAGNTLFLPGGTEVTTPAAGGTAKATRYYSHKEVVIAVRTATGLDMIGDKGLAMKATAFRLRDLMDFVKENTPAEMRKSHSPEQLAAATYNIGTQSMEDSFKRGSLGPLGTSYRNSAMSYYCGSSDKIICHSGLYTC